MVVVATTKVGIFKQITTIYSSKTYLMQLLLLPQRQEFSSKSQHIKEFFVFLGSCCCYHKGRNFQANHNDYQIKSDTLGVVVATTKVGIFKQITTVYDDCAGRCALLLLPQRQEFSSKSQPRQQLKANLTGCCCYHKGRNFQANHNVMSSSLTTVLVVVATTKVGIFKQITTLNRTCCNRLPLLLLPQRQEFSSKSQQSETPTAQRVRCCCYHKGRNFQANHNRVADLILQVPVVVATTKVGIFKQITTAPSSLVSQSLLLLIPQRQEFSSKSQLGNS